MKITILTLFPEYFHALLETSIIKRARESGLFELECVDFRNYTQDKHRHVDDSPYGGGAGMVLSCQPLLDALEDVRTDDSLVILLSPQGKVFEQKTALDLSREKHLVIICGHYEGFDERIRSYVDVQISLGDYVLTGGEPAASVLCDAVIRLLPGTIKDESSTEDSFSNGLLEYPQYTRPYDYKGQTVPDILLSGHHENIRKWRREQSLLRTKQYRPDLLETAELTPADIRFLESLENKDKG